MTFARVAPGHCPPSLSVAPRCSRRWREKIHSLCALLTPSPANYLIYIHANYLELRCCKPPCGLRTVLPPPLARSTDGARAMRCDEMRCDAIADSFVVFSFSWCVSATHSPEFLLCCFGPAFAGVPLVIRLSLLLYRPRSLRLSHRPVSRDLATLIPLWLSVFLFAVFLFLLLTNTVYRRRCRGSGAAINTPRVFRRLFCIFDDVDSVSPAPRRLALLSILA